MSHRSCRLLLATLVSLTCGVPQLLAQEGGFAARFMSTGSIDTSFGDRGSTRVFGYDGMVQAAAVDGQNRVVIAGTRDAKFVVTRLLSSGAVDESFGSDGVAEKAFASAAEARAVAIDPWGRIIVAGTSAHQFAVACFSSSGGACQFKDDSKVTTSFAGSQAEAAAIAIDNDGRIVVGGRASWWTSTGGEDQMFALARYTPSGDLDPSFGTNGKRRNNVQWATAPNTNVESISSLAIDASGRILAAGTFAAQNVSPRFALLRLADNGALDTTFGPNSSGMATAFWGCVAFAWCFDESYARSLAVQPDGKIVVAGAARIAGAGSLAHDLALARFLPTGALDSSGFGTNGHVRKNLGSFEEANAVRVAGDSLYLAGHSLGQAFVARYWLSNGAPVTEFGDGGVATAPPTPCEGPAFALVIQTFVRGGIPLPYYTRKPVAVGTCLSWS